MGERVVWVSERMDEWIDDKHLESEQIGGGTPG